MNTDKFGHENTKETCTALALSIDQFCHPLMKAVNDVVYLERIRNEKVIADFEKFSKKKLSAAEVSA